MYHKATTKHQSLLIKLAIFSKPECSKYKGSWHVSKTVRYWLMSLANAKMRYSCNCNHYYDPLISRDNTDNWGTYERHLPADQHEVGKKHTQKIERKNLNLRTWVKRLTRKTIYFSKSRDNARYRYWLADIDLNPAQILSVTGSWLHQGQ